MIQDGTKRSKSFDPGKGTYSFWWPG